MQIRILPWLFLCAIFAAVSLRGQTVTPVVARSGQEKILVAKIKGVVTITIDGKPETLKEGAFVPEKAKINTANNASVVLVFSNGSTTHLDSDSEMVIEEYLQDPFDTAVAPAKADAEPSASVTKLALNRGEIVGDVKRLNYAKGSSFKVQTPVGAAGIRGTIFRIVFRPGGTGQAFFTLSTAAGNVAFDQGGQGGVTAQGIATGLAIPQGQEIAIEVSVTTNAQGQMVVTVMPPPVTQTSNISQANLQAVTSTASDIAVAVQNLIFNPPPPGSGGPTTITGQNFSGEATTPPPPLATPPRIITTNPNN